MHPPTLPRLTFWTTQHETINECRLFCLQQLVVEKSCLVNGWQFTNTAWSIQHSACGITSHWDSISLLKYDCYI